VGNHSHLVGNILLLLLYYLSILNNVSKTFKLNIIELGHSVAPAVHSTR